MGGFEFDRRVGGVTDNGTRKYNSIARKASAFDSSERRTTRPPIAFKSSSVPSLGLPTPNELPSTEPMSNHVTPRNKTERLSVTKKQSQESLPTPVPDFFLFEPYANHVPNAVAQQVQQQ